MIKFEWNQTKAISNRRKHGVTFEEAVTVFFDESAIQFFDSENSAAEDRFLMLGRSAQFRILPICYQEQSRVETIRIISARKATNNERMLYPANSIARRLHSHLAE